MKSFDLGTRASYLSIGVISSLIGLCANPVHASDNLIQDPGFETSTSGFYPQYPSDTVLRSTTTPIAGSASLKVSLHGWNSAWWNKNVAGTSLQSGTSFTVSG